jgi:hypothetical protein
LARDWRWLGVGRLLGEANDGDAVEQDRVQASTQVDILRGRFAMLAVVLRFGCDWTAGFDWVFGSWTVVEPCGSGEKNRDVEEWQVHRL